MNEWVDAFLAWTEVSLRASRRARQIEAAAAFIYPTPIWAGGMSDLPIGEPDIRSARELTKKEKKEGHKQEPPRPRTARGYAIRLVDIVEAI